MRRPFYEIAASGSAPIAAEALARIAEFYAIEVEIRGRSADERRAIRQEKTRPLVDGLKTRLEAQLSTIAEAIRYALTRWSGLTRFIDDGRVEIDPNVVERTIRPLILNGKNALFADSDGGGHHWAILASLIETCRPNGVDPQAYLAGVFARLVVGYPIKGAAQQARRAA
jgi:hypothetical protein